MAACRQMRSETYDTEHDFDKGTRAIRPERPEVWQSLPVGFYNGDPTIANIIRRTREGLARRLREKGMLK